MAKEVMLKVRVSEVEMAALKAAAKRHGVTVSEWVRRCASVMTARPESVESSAVPEAPPAPVRTAPSSSAAGTFVKCDNCRRKGISCDECRKKVASGLRPV